MKTILYNPIFINPQAYYVFPRLTRYLQPDNESTAEPANYIGTIEVKVIAYGDTTLKRTYTNTDSIYLSEFKNTWIRISLFTKVGSCVLGEWKIGNMESDLPYIDPEVLASLKVVVIVGNKTNNDSDRSIVKNLVDPDNPFVISNAAYTEGSGYADKGSPYYGAFVTDGIDDLITSTKTAEEMGITDEVTVVSMIHQINANKNFTTTNNLRNENRVIGRNTVTNIGKTGIYGWYKKDIQGTTATLIDNILGDKNDYTGHYTESTNSVANSKFYVTGYAVENGFTELSSVAWYWTIIANKVLTTDQINQVIAYFNLDRTLKPDILCNVKRQRITNENHAEFNDKLIDYSGNGRDIQLNNIAWNKESGIDDNGALCLDGVIDFGKVTGMPVYKDYTVVTDREIFANIGAISSKNNPGAFVETAGNSVYSFGQATSGLNFISTRSISYLSKYSYCGQSITAGAAEDGTDMWLGTIRDNDSRFFNGAIYSLMSFPYSMSKFLIERQLKKHKLGTLYPNMVELRPIIKSDIDILKIDYWDKDWNVLHIGDYVSIGNDIKTNITVPNGYKISKVTSDAFDNITILKSSTGFIYDVKFYGIKKSPQKINLTIEQDENYVKFEPIITANANYRINYYLIANNAWNSIKTGDYITIGSKLGFQILFDNDASELKEFVSSQLSDIVIQKRPSASGYNIYSAINSESPQNINITIDEYIRYEDIVQPYPVLLRFNDENGNEVSWGGKFRVGSTITRIGSAADSNLLPNIYNIFGLLLNDNQVTSSKVIVEKTMVFKAKSAYIFDNNEPKCILSPSRLRIPNSSYKLLGYIPDISGHGNHGVIHNSAYAKGSGVNEDGSYQFDGVDDFVTIPTVTGGKQVLMKVNWQSIAGTAILYDQRTNGGFAIFNRDYDTNENKVPAYRARNIGGNTYIDGILNEYIYASQLQNITHNIVELYDPELNIGTLNPKIGSSYLNSNYAQMSLYDFMLFDNISTDDKIKELNEYVGIEAKVELPPYYWDAYGKTNLDEDKATIQQRGVAVGDYDLTNHNHAYEGMSGYNGYPVVFGANKTWENFSSVYSYTSDVTSTTIHITRVKNAGTGLLFSYVKKDGALTNIREIPAFRVTVKGLEGNSKFGYRYLATEDATVETLVYLGNGTHELSKSFTPTEALLDLTRNAWVGIFITPMVEGEVVFDCDITIEVLPEYENGLVYDGVDDYSKNENIPVLTDYTIIAKRLWINKDNPLNEQFIHKGAINTPISESAFMLEYEIANDTYYRSSSYGGYINIERSNRPERIVYQTSNSYNGTSITKGSGTDTTGIVIGGVTNNYWNGVFYKLMLYSKTLPLLQINYLKNLMEKDEIIDLNNKIFIQE